MLKEHKALINMFKNAKIHVTTDNVAEAMEDWAEALSTSTESVMNSLGLSFDYSELDDSKHRVIAQSRLREIYALLSIVRPWFRSDMDCWTWFVNKQLTPFSDLTPSEVVTRYQSRGIKSLRSWVNDRNMGHFQ